MSLKKAILNNWEIDIVGFAHRISELDSQYPGWTVKFNDSYGVAIPYSGNESINEFFSNAHIKSDTLVESDGSEQKAIILAADFSVARGPFSTLCEELLSPGENGRNRISVTQSPVAWWKEWKELLGNRNIDEKVYDTLGELCVLKYLISVGEDANFYCPNSSTYDIEIENGFVEVKSTISRSKREVTISNQFQLDPPGKKMNLVLCQFEHSVQNGISILLSGISLGGQYALIAIGYTMVYGILRLINFAHGDVFMVAGLMMVYFTTWMPLYLAIPLMIAATVLLGFLIERVAYKPLRTAPRMSVMISAIGVSYFIQNMALYITGGLNKNYPAIPWISDPVRLFGMETSRVTVITPFLTIALVIALVLLINHTKIGMAMRAVSVDFETAQLMGIKINSVISATFIIGTFLAAVGSVLFFTNFPGVVPTSGAMPGLKAFVAAVFGGIGSVPGAVVGAFIIGICESVIKGLDTILMANGAITEQVGFATFSDAFTFVLLIVILVFKPTGLFGEKTTDKV